MAFDDEQGGFLPGATADQGGFFGSLTPQKYGLLAAGLGILANANGPNSRNAVGAGALQGLAAYQGAQNSQALQGYRNAQIKKIDSDQRNKERIAEILGGAGQSKGPLLASADGSIPTGGMPRSGGSLANTTLDQIVQIKALGGPDLTEAWKLAHFGQDSAPGSTTVKADGSTRYNVRLPDGLTWGLGPDGKPAVVPAPNYANANAAIQGAQVGAQEAAKLPYDVARTNAAAAARPNKFIGPGGNEYATNDLALAQGGASGQQPMMVGRNPVAQAFDASVAGASADTYNNLQKAAAGADSQISKLQKIGSLLGDYDGNKFSPTGLELAKFGKSIGLDLGSNVGNKEAAQALSNELALSARNTADGGGMPGAMSDADRQFLVSINPSLANTAEGRKQMIDAKVKVLNRQKDVAMFARKWRQKFGRLDSLGTGGDDFQTALSKWSAANPLFPQEQ